MSDLEVDQLEVRAYTVPTDLPEGDGTLTWDSTTVVTVAVSDGSLTGLGWTYASAAAVDVIRQQLEPVVAGASLCDIPELAERMARACRNLGRPGIAACAISAVDTALWDLRARQLGVPLVELFGRARDTVPVYGSGGFTTYDDRTIRRQLSTWVEDWAIPRAKIKIGESWGTATDRDLARVAVAREVVGAGVELYVDANGGYDAKQAIRIGRVMTERHGVTWFEEPVSSDDHQGLHAVRRALDADVTAGEYGYSLGYFTPLVVERAIDCVQVDVTRCGGYTVWRQVAALAAAFHLDVSGHCAPNLHAHVAASIPNLRHVEYFHDHHRIETSLFDGALPPNGGSMTPDPSVPGHGMTLKDVDAERYRVR